MKAALSMIILYVQDIQNLKEFYREHFGLTLVEEDEVWVVLNAGSIHIGFHKIGAQFLEQLEPNHRFDNNSKLIFEIDGDLEEIRSRFVSNNIKMREIKTFENYDFWLCDGVDPEGNVFQLKSRKKEIS